MLLNYSISSIANVLALVNAKNGSNITEAQVIVNEIVESDENPGDNTKITLTGVDGKGIEGTRSFYYGRVAVITPPTVVTLAPGEVGGEAVAKIIAQLGIRLEDIYYDGWVFPTEGVDGGVNIWGAPDSPIYSPEVNRLTLTQSA
jgi:hypothetical protein